MATFDSADLFARLLRATGRPTTDSDLDSTKAYALLGDAQRATWEELAIHVPWANYATPELMTTSDSKTYSATGEFAGPIEVYATLGGELLREGAYWDTGADYTREGASSIRITNNRTRSFGTTGPYVRYAKRPGLLDASTQPTLLPTAARQAVVYLAAANYAEIGGYRDPSPYYRQYRIVLWGDPELPGSSGIIPALKAQMDSGNGTGLWYRSADLH